jgi:UDP-galactopyranose mutase
MRMYDYLIVGAGFAGAVLAERLAAERDKKILLIDKRDHIGGNAYDYYDEYGILVHKYGPHIFHTNSKKVYDYLSMFTEWIPYEHKVLASHNNISYPIPINRITLNKLYNLNLLTDEEAEVYYELVREKRSIRNSEDIIISKTGKDIYERFFKHYTIKQWNIPPDKLAPSVCGRIPVRTGLDCRYFTDTYQAMPSEGYTKMFNRMLNHPNITVVFNKSFSAIEKDVKFNKLIYTGPVDEYFSYCFGKLPYRSLKMEFENHKLEYYQEAAVINFVDPEVPFTRLTEYKYLTGQKSESTTISKEFSISGGEPFYPIPAEENDNLFRKYIELTKGLNNVYFCGRLALYRYYNMDQVIAMSLTQVKNL